MYVDEVEVQTWKLSEDVAWLAVWTHLLQVSWWWIKMKLKQTIFHSLLLIFQSFGQMFLFYRHLLSADTREDRLLWCMQL